MGQVIKFKLHHVFQGKDEVIGTFEVRDGEIVFPSERDKHQCDMFPPGPMSNYTKNRITHLLNNKEKTTYLEEVSNESVEKVEERARKDVNNRQRPITPKWDNPRSPYAGEVRPSVSLPSVVPGGKETKVGPVPHNENEE